MSSARWGVAVVVAWVSFGTVASASWPVARHDAKRTGAADGTSNIVAPVPYWRAFLGGRLASNQLLADDVNKDGKVDILFVAGGRVVAKTPEDDTVWATPALGIEQLIGIDDLDGDGFLDVVASSVDHAYVISGATGIVEWAEPDGEMGRLSGTRLSDIDGDGRADLAVEECGCCLNNSGKTGFVYSFAAGFSAPKLVWTLPTVACGAAAALTIVDIDGTGKPAVLAASFTTLSLLDGLTGVPLAETAPLGDWTAASQCQPGNIDGEPGDELVCINNVSNPPANQNRRVFALHYAVATHTLSVAWSQTIAGTVGDIAVFNLLVDLDGDGKREVVAAGKSDSNVWTTYVFDAATGMSKGTLPGELLAGTAVVDQPQAPIVLTTGTSGLKGWRFDASHSPTLVQQWALTGQQTLSEPDWRALRRSSLGTRPVTVDLDGDGVMELVTQATTDTGKLSAYKVSGGQAVPFANLTLPTGVEPSAVWMMPSIGGNVSRLAVARNDGYLELLDQALQPATKAPHRLTFGNFFVGGGREATRSPVAGPLDDTAKDRVILADSRGAVVRFDGDDASWARSPSPRWSVAHASSPSVVSTGPSTHGVACFRSTTPAGGPTQDNVLMLRADGTLAWSVPTDAAPWTDMVATKIDGDNIPDLLFQWASPTDVFVQTRAISGSNGATLWNAAPVSPGPGRLATALTLSDWTGDGIDDAIFQGAGTYVLSGVNGVVAAQGGPTDTYFMATAFDVDNDGVDEFTYHGGFTATQTYRHDLQTVLWKATDEDRPFSYGAIAKCAGGPVLAEGSWRDPARLNLTYIGGPSTGSLRSVVLAGGRLFANEAAATAAGAALTQLTSTSVHANLTGKNHPSAAVASSGGWLYSVDPCSATLDFALRFDAPVSAPIFADTDGDGLDEILVTVADGYLYDVKNEAVKSPTFVWDVDPDHGITTRDVDDVETMNTLSARWGAVSGATGYAVAVLDESGAFVSNPPWQNVGVVTLASITNLALRDGARYLMAVRALSAAGPSVDALSNGAIVRVPAIPDAGGDAMVDASNDVFDASVDVASDARPDVDEPDAGADVALDVQTDDGPPDALVDSHEAGLDVSRDVGSEAGDDGSIDGGGCDCRAAPGRSTSSSAGALGILALTVVARRRRSASRERPPLNPEKRLW